MTKFRRFKLSPIERGWSGTKLPGRSLGPPDPVGEGTIKNNNLQKKLLEFLYLALFVD